MVCALANIIQSSEDQIHSPPCSASRILAGLPDRRKFLPPPGAKKPVECSLSCPPWVCNQISFYQISFYQISFHQSSFQQQQHTQHPATCLTPNLAPLQPSPYHAKWNFGFLSGSLRSTTKMEHTTQIFHPQLPPRLRYPRGKPQKWPSSGPL